MLVKKFKKIIPLIFILCIVLAASLIFYLRYKTYMSYSNFYAEDGLTYVNNILNRDPITVLFTGFNGYLITGTYLLLELAVGVSRVFGLHFYQIPYVISIISYLFLGLSVSLPYILFRKELGKALALLTVLVSAFVPLPTFDFAIIGTVANHKFLFLYWAVLLVLYRNIKPRNTRSIICVDVLLLLCIATYAPAVFLLPFLIAPYYKTAYVAIRHLEWRRLLQPPLISALSVCLACTAYLGVILALGIPKLPGYLDTAYNWHATVKIIYRVTFYVWLYPIGFTMRDLLTILLLLAFLVVAFRKKADRFVSALCLFAITVSTVSFVANRPGISEYFSGFGQTPDQFFFAQNLIFIFLAAWLVRSYVNKSRIRQAITGFFIFLFLWWSVPFGSSFGRSISIYQARGSAKYNLDIQCKQTRGETVTFMTFPDPIWNWKLARSIACN